MYPKSVSFDTNLLIRFILHDVPDQAEKVVAVLKNPRVREVHVADMAVAEVVWILGSPRVGMDRKSTAEALSIVFKHPKLHYNSGLFDSVLPFYISHPAISFVDACLAGYAQSNQTQLLTFDKKLSRQSKHAKLL